MKTPDLFLINNWYVIASVDDCGPGNITTARLFGIQLVLWRSHEPNSPLHVWQDYCPHRGVQLSIGEVTDDTLVCPYHGWRYNQAGQCIRIPAHPNMKPPASAQVKTYQCQERYGLVWVCLGNPTNEIPIFPEWDEKNYHKTCTQSYFIQASAFRVMDNSLDLSHFPFIHDGWLGNRHHAQMRDFDVKVDQDGITMKRYQFQASRVVSNIADDSWVNYFKLNHPLCQYCISESPEIRIADLVTITPIDEDNSVMRMLITWNCSTTLESDILEEYDETIEQDIRILHAQQPVRLPLLLPLKQISTQGLPQEVHVPSDRCTVTYRRWLKELGVTYGVC